MQKYITVLGSTGSVGKNALDVIEHSRLLAVYGLSVNKNIELLEEQVKKFRPAAVAIRDKEAAEKFQQICREKGYYLVVYKGKEGVAQLASQPRPAMVLNSIVGNAGIRPTLSALEAGKDVALANKEALVSAGELIIRTAKRHGASIIPVDSEHSAIFQCLYGNPKGQIEKIILTASGGPFRGKTREQLKNVTAKEALKHPTWDMGAKITIDSATLMNKGLEVIEAYWLFGVDIKKIDTVIHPQSIIHSMVEFTDGSVLAQMGEPDMRFPIHYALNYPDRLKNPFPKLDLIRHSPLTFEAPDENAFPCLELAYNALKIGGTMPCVLNEVNQALVNLFLYDEIGFYDIPNIISDAMKAYVPVYDYDIRELDRARVWAREYVLDRMQGKERI